MAKAPRGVISGVLNTIRGQFTPRDVEEPAVVKQERILVTETVSDAVRKGTRIAKGTLGGQRNQNLLSSTAFGNQIYLTAAERKQQNLEIMEMFPDLERNAKYLIASYFSPVDLNITKIPVSFSGSGLSSNHVTNLQEKLTDYYERHLELSSELPDIAYNMGFVSGGELIVTVPKLSIMSAFDSVVSTEALKTKLDDLPAGVFSNKTETSLSMESLRASSVDLDTHYTRVTKDLTDAKPVCDFLERAISTESLTLSGNLGILSAKSQVEEQNAVLHRKQALGENYRVKATPEPTGMLPAPTPKDGMKAIDRPTTLRVSAESAFMIFPPGAPDKPIAAILMLDETGSPLSMGSYGGMTQTGATIVSGATSNSLFQDVGRATTRTSNTEYMQMEGQRQLQDLYRTFMSSYITKKAADAGYGTVSIGDTESVMQNLFYRYLERKATRMLIIPKEFFTYFTFSVGLDGIGRTKIEGIKQYLVMKMTVMISRVLAAMRAAADTRNITVTVDTSSMVPEDVLRQAVINGYCAKNLLDLSSLDLNSIQSRIVSSALQISIKNTSGATDGAYEITNEPATQGKPFDFDPELLAYIDSQINNKVPVPASLTSSLDEPELATTITTANLFYSMLVSMDQRRISRAGTSWIRQHGRHSQEVRDIVQSIISPTADKDGKSAGDRGSLGENASPSNGITVDEVIDQLSIVLPKPIISKSSAQFTNITNLTDSVSKIVDIIYPDAFLDDDTQKAALSSIKAAAMRDCVSSLAADAGMTQLNLGSTNVNRSLEEVFSFRETMANAAKGLAEQKSLSEATASDNSGSEPTEESTSDNGGYL